MSHPPAQPITGLTADRIAPHVFLCGDPERVPRISASWQNAREVCRVREYRVVTGELAGVPLCAASTGIGAPSTAVILEELVKLGAHTFIRVGNSGGLAPDLGARAIWWSRPARCATTAPRSVRDPRVPGGRGPRDRRRAARARRARAARSTARASPGRSTLSTSATRCSRADGGMASMSVGGYWAHEHRRAHRGHARGARGELRDGERRAAHARGAVRRCARAAFASCADRTPWRGPERRSTSNRNMAQCIEVATDAMLSVARR